MCAYFGRQCYVLMFLIAYVNVWQYGIVLWVYAECKTDRFYSCLFLCNSEVT